MKVSDVHTLGFWEASCGASVSFAGLLVHPWGEQVEWAEDLPQSWPGRKSRRMARSRISSAMLGGFLEKVAHHRVICEAEGEVSISRGRGFRNNFLRAWDKEDGAYFPKGTCLKIWGDGYLEDVCLLSRIWVGRGRCSLKLPRDPCLCLLVFCLSLSFSSLASRTTP